MPRLRVLDHLQVFPFWVVDLSWSPFAGVAFTPLLGFQSCTSPEITLELGEVQEGNWPYPHHYIKKATISEITLTRGIQFYDSDFYRWVQRAIEGRGMIKRDLMLVHYFNISAVTLGTQIQESPKLLGSLGIMAGMQAAMMTKILMEAPVGGAQVFAAQTGGIQNTATGNLMGSYAPPVDHAPRFPAKAWILRKCLPTRWKGASDFDAMSSDISIAELGIQPNRIEELAVAT